MVLSALYQGSEAIPQKRQKLESEILTEEKDQSDEEAGDLDLIKCVKVGSLKRLGRDRLYSMRLDPSGRILCCHGNENQMEMFRINNEEEVRKHLNKRQKKARKRARESSEGTDSEGYVQ